MGSKTNANILALAVTDKLMQVWLDVASWFFCYLENIKVTIQRLIKKNNFFYLIM